jgi:hypothetical protein
MKVKYSLRDNLLIINRNGRELRFPGTWSIDADNHAVYTFVGLCPGRLEEYLPEKIIFKGQWALDANHNLTLNLNQAKTQGSGKLNFKTSLVSFESNCLIFSLGAVDSLGSYKVRRLRLEGRWQADKDNRLCFLVNRTGLRQEIFTLEGSWKVKNNTLTYAYKTTDLKTKKKALQELSFEGLWDISSKNRLVYILYAELNSLFRFRVYFQTPSIQGKKGAIQYRLGAGVRKGSRDKIITLYGVWKFSKTGISFEMDYGGSRIKAVRFRAVVKFKTDKELVFYLKSARGED